MLMSSCDLNTALLVPMWTSAVLNLISLRRIWYLHVESGIYDLSSESVASLVRIVSACSRHHIPLPCTYVEVDRVQTVCIPLTNSHLMSGKQAVGAVVSASQMFTNSSRLIVLDQMGFIRQNQIQDTMSFFSVVNWVRLISKEIPLAGWCSCAPREEWWSLA